MTKQQTLRCSHSRSGLNIYLPDDAVKALPKSTFSVEVVSRRDAPGFLVSLRANEGGNRLSAHADPERPYRLTVPELRKSGILRKDLDLFGTTDLSWGVGDGDIRLQFCIPPHSELPAPMVKRPRKNVGDSPTRQLTLGLQAAVDETPHAKLGRLLREVNALLCSGAVNDVEIKVESLVVGHEEPQTYTYYPGLTSIKGRIVREEFIG